MERDPIGAEPLPSDLEPDRRGSRRQVMRLFETPERLLEAIVAAEVLGLPLALRTTSSDRRTF
jgi:hypothetical protein